MAHLKLNSRYATSGYLAEMNVTPMVDVMLVLLIVFMISAPLMQQGMKVDLPKAKGDALSAKEPPLILTVQASRKMLLGKKVIAPGTLIATLAALVKEKPGLEIVIEADHKLNYGVLAEIMSEIKTAGIQHLGLVTEPPPPTLRPQPS